MLRALPTELLPAFYFGDPGGLRSHSPHIKSMVLSRLSYEVIFFARVPRFELGTTVLETGMIPFHYTRVF